MIANIHSELQFYSTSSINNNNIFLKIFIEVNLTVHWIPINPILSGRNDVIETFSYYNPLSIIIMNTYPFSTLPEDLLLP